MLLKDLENYCRERLLLFTHWHNEETDLKGPYNTYADAYYAIKNAGDQKAAEYEHNTDVLAAALQAAIDEEGEAFDELAPGTEQVEREDAEEGDAESSQYFFYKPQVQEHQNVDIGLELGFPSAGPAVEIESHGVRLPEEQYQELMRCLNTKQLEIFTHTIQWIKTQHEPLRLAILGGA